MDNRTVRYSPEFDLRLRDYLSHVARAEGLPRPDRRASYATKREIFTVECRRKMPLAILERYVNLHGAVVLDAGCGTGRNSVLCAEAGSLVTGIDIDLQALDVARARCEEHQVTVDFSPADVLNLPFNPSSFDIIISHGVLEHIPGSLHGRAISEMARVLRPGGLLFIMTPNRLSPFDTHSSRLPLLHWLPRSLTRFVSVLGIPAPHEDLPSYDNILRAAGEAAAFVVLNRCDVWENLNDYRRHWVNYSNSFGLTAKLYFRLIPSMYIASRILRTELNKWLPSLNLFLKKL